jgi:predicted MFS family arabinose efflux permease
MTGHLSFELMALVAFVMGSLGIVFDVTYEGFMTEVIEIEDLTEGFQKLEVTASGAGVIGPGIGGVLLSAAGAALTIGLNAISYLVSAASLFLTHRRADLVRVVSAPSNLRGELSAGLRLVFADRILRDLTISTAMLNLGSGIVIPLIVIFATRNLGLNAGEYGLLYSITSTGFVLGASSVGLFGRRLGSGRGLTIAATGFAFSILLVPMASPGFGVLFLVAARFLNSASNTTFRVLLMSLIQTRADPAFRSRITSAERMITWGALPIGSLVGGALASGAPGMVGALVVAGIMPLVGVLILRTGPVWRVRLDSLKLTKESASA